MKNLSFKKMSGAGNDFIIIDEASNPQFTLSNIGIKQLCDRRNGIGADGIIIINDVDSYDFKMDYFNADGSTGSLCGNGARCAIKYASNSGRLKNNTANFISDKVVYSGELLNDGLVRFNLKPPEKIIEKILVKTSGYEIFASFINCGSPHIVIDVNDLNDVFPDQSNFHTGLKNIPVVQIGREIRNDPAFKPEGTNVNFIEVINGIVNIRTYERGVEDETLACGTGAVASAIIASGRYGLATPISLMTKGREELVVDFKLKVPDYNNITLTGPAREVFSGEISLNTFS